MSNSTSPVPLPAPEPENTPNLSVTPPPAAKRDKSALNEKQVQQVNDHKVIALAAQDPALAPTLELREILPAFVVALLVDIEAALHCGSKAVCLTDKKEGITLEGQNAAQDLVNDLRVAQAAARQKYLHSQPTKLKDYFIGERIDSSKGKLDQCAQGVVARMNEERPPGVNTEFIKQIDDKRAKITQSQGAQGAAGGQAMTERELRDGAVDSIKQRVQQIQFAADAAWPSHVPANAGIRQRFHLPLDRPFTA